MSLSTDTESAIVTKIGEKLGFCVAGDDVNYDTFGALECARGHASAHCQSATLRAANIFLPLLMLALLLLLLLLLLLRLTFAPVTLEHRDILAKEITTLHGSASKALSDLWRIAAPGRSPTLLLDEDQKYDDRALVSSAVGGALTDMAPLPLPVLPVL